ncbi:lysophospholipid acyltransferase family protein [Mangrovicoccus algicola]|uniref:Lysophospholipid acyltransferase family protein n=1 Tax=Mangrovicoccus algicola TaxID=2771008 RepID=A0A8J6YXG1_9RHOB|nr:lysophospholipid acyltransferase family protein [Mangrovicoccus algicola]MBE3637673.1 lysophospholipid acyltransferase family protein [Mangrovicoccus algicola]
MAKKTKSARQAAWEAAAIRALLSWPKVLPFGMRRAVVAWLMAWIVAPVAGYRGRIRANLAHVMPDLPEPEIRRLMRRVPANVGRMLTELAAGEEFLDLLRDEPLTGPGVGALDEARAAGRPVIVVSGHFGNFDAMRGVLALRGHRIGAIYRPLNDAALDADFLAMLTAIAEPVFPRGRAGLARMIRFLKQGNAVAILPDQYVNRGEALTFFGQPAPTALSAAEMALKYDALLVPVYGIRRGDGGFDLVVEAPVPHGEARAMSQALNDSLEARIRDNMDQWLWIHRRWKPARQAKRAARAAKG